MINDKQKTKLTAYALGELSGKDRENIDQLLLKDQEAKQFVEEVRQTAAMLEQEFSFEEKPVLTETERNKLDQVWRERSEQEAGTSQKLSQGFSFFKWWVMAPIGGLVAAMLALVLMLPQVKENLSVNKSGQLLGASSPQSEVTQAPAMDPADSFSTADQGKAESYDVADSEYELADVDDAQTGEISESGDVDGMEIAGNAAPSQPVERKAIGGLAKRQAMPAKESYGRGSGGADISKQGLAKGMGAPSAPPPATAGIIATMKKSDAKNEMAVGTRSRVGGKARPQAKTKAKKVMAAGRDKAREERLKDHVASEAAAPATDEVDFIPSPEPESIPERVEEAEPEHSGEGYDLIEENDFLSVNDQPLSTFSIDVDTASYSNLRRFIESGSLPPVDSIRIEEMINYFPYAYAPPKGPHPFAVHTEVATSPWSQNRLVRIALKGKEVDMKDRPPANLVFLLDVSGSMADENKLPLLKRSFKLLVDSLHQRDRVSIVVYAGASGMVLPATSGDKKTQIMGALDRLEAGGSTNGGSGIQLAYKVAKENFKKGGINRVILATDGDFNVGTTSRSELIRMIADKAKEGTFLTVLGLGMGNLKDGTLEQLANKGNGNYAYIDSDREANKIFVEQLAANLVTIAKDVKIQVEFNPTRVSHYRLIGYENRRLNKEDFNDDKKDAGEIGAGHTVTALYEVTLVGQPGVAPKVDALKYQSKPTVPVKGKYDDELLTVKLRYKQPQGSKSTLIQVPVKDSNKTIGQADADFRFASAVASFGMLLRGSKYKGTSSHDKVLDWATGATQVKNKKDSYRLEFIDLVRRAKELKR